MPKFTVEFTIEAESLGHATNRALVALYKGDLDAEEVNVSAKGEDKYRTFGETPDNSKPKLARGGYVQGRAVDYLGRLGDWKNPNPPNPQKATLEPGEIAVDKEAVKKIVQELRNPPKEPSKDELD